jgi:hypothetical protein
MAKLSRAAITCDSSGHTCLQEDKNSPQTETFLRVRRQINMSNSENSPMSNLALNPNIITNIAPSSERGTTTFRIEDLPPTPYNPKYFETIPTVWASAYAFERLLYQNDQTAIEEWVSLLALHFFGVLGIARLTTEQINTIYEPRLWEAMSGTYPKVGREPIQQIDLLRNSDGITVGGGYEATIFFPSRGRSSWQHSKLITPFIKDGRLSWQRCSERLLNDAPQCQRFYDHLWRISYYRLQGLLRERLVEFCRQAAIFKGLPPRERSSLSSLDMDPTTWNIYPDHKPSSLLQAYPLRRRNQLGGFTYYLVNDLPILSPWMMEAPAGMPTPLQYRKDPEHHGILVSLAKGIEKCSLEEPDRVVSLASFFLHKENDFTYFSKMPQHAAPVVRGFHKHQVRESRGLFADLNVDDGAICLAPIRSDLLHDFSELLQRPQDRITTLPVNRGEGVEYIEWHFKLNNSKGEPLDVVWHTTPNYSKDFFVSSLSLWPPQVSPDWNFYVMHGQGQDIQSGSFWQLIDENGTLGKFEKLGQDSYSTTLLGDGRPSRPAALRLSDKQTERGVLFLGELPEKQVKNNFEARLAVDFGTSNTCLAYKYSGQGVRPQTEKLMRFSLTPLAIWELGQRTDLPGCIPITWGGEKGFFPTALLARINATPPNPANIGPEHLFHVDIPTLHSKEMVDAWARDMFKDWVTHAESELKWKHGQNEPWRSLFLTLVVLYAQAELFFKEGLVVDEYICTYPLSFSKRQRDGFHTTTRQVIKNTRAMCYSQRFNPSIFNYRDFVNESIAVAAYIDANPQSTAMDIFLDIGGGTTDIAVRYRDEFLVLDSLRVAGRTFFRFSERNYELQSLPGSSEFKKYLYLLLTETKTMGEEWDRQALSNLDLATQYSVSINKVNDTHIVDVEGRILDAKMGERSFQRYRSQLFFRHLLAYALVQGCAAALSVADRQTEQNEHLLADGFHLILGGNAWGLLMFAEFERSDEYLLRQADRILQILKEILLAHADEKDKKRLEKLKVTRVDLLNVEDLATAKTAAALGALKVTTALEQSSEKLAPYAGINIAGLKLNRLDKSIQIAWKQRWSLETINDLMKLSLETIDELMITGASSLRHPFDPLLSLFSRLGNPAQPHIDPLPEDEWERINAALIRGEDYLEQGELKYSPLQIFLTRILYPEKTAHPSLEKLAEVTGHFKRKN